MKKTHSFSGGGDACVGGSNLLEEVDVGHRVLDVRGEVFDLPAAWRPVQEKVKRLQFAKFVVFYVK